MVTGPAWIGASHLRFQRSLEHDPEIDGPVAVTLILGVTRIAIRASKLLNDQLIDESLAVSIPTSARMSPHEKSPSHAAARPDGRPTGAGSMTGLISSVVSTISPDANASASPAATTSTVLWLPGPAVSVVTRPTPPAAGSMSLLTTRCWPTDGGTTPAANTTAPDPSVP